MRVAGAVGIEREVGGGEAVADETATVSDGTGPRTVD